MVFVHNLRSSGQILERNWWGDILTFSVKDAEKDFARKALYVLFSGNYVSQLCDELELDFSDDKDAIFLMLCGEHFFLENRVCRPKVLVLQVLDMVDDFRGAGHEQGALNADILEEYWPEILEEYTKNRGNYYLQFMHYFGANPEIFDIISKKYMSLMNLLDDRFDMDFLHVAELTQKMDLSTPQIFAYENVSPPHLKILCDFFEAEGCPELFKSTNLIYLTYVKILKDRLLES